MRRDDTADNRHDQLAKLQHPNFHYVRWNGHRFVTWAEDEREYLEAAYNRAVDECRRKGTLPKSGVNWRAVEKMDWRDVTAKYRAPGVRSNINGRCAEGHRSTVIYRIIANLMDKGATAEEAACAAVASKAYQSRRDDKGEREARRDIERIIAKRRSA